MSQISKSNPKPKLRIRKKRQDVSEEVKELIEGKNEIKKNVPNKISK